jgi:hypothetical protein
VLGQDGESVFVSDFDLVETDWRDPRYQVIIGRDVLAFATFTYYGRDHYVTLDF